MVSLPQSDPYRSVSARQIHQQPSADIATKKAFQIKGTEFRCSEIDDPTDIFRGIFSDGVLKPKTRLKLDSAEPGTDCSSNRSVKSIGPAR